jgi:hypothetical protein
MTKRKFTPFVDDGIGTKYMTRSGEVARVCLISTQTESTQILRGFTKGATPGRWIACSWYLDGSVLHKAQHRDDLFDIPVKHTRWVNVYPSGVFYSITTSFPTKEAADSYAAKHRVACIEVTFEEGEGL